MEVYRGRLIAYSLGNFSGYHNFSTEGVLGVTVVLHATLAADGRFRSGRLASVRMIEAGQPVPTPKAPAPPSSPISPRKTSARAGSRSAPAAASAASVPAVPSPLLLINGYAATGADWDPTFLAELERRHRVIHPDNRGTGGVPLGEAELTIEAMAADMEALLDAEGIGRLPVVGWSMGGFVAQRLALRAPQRVSALALISSDPGGAAAVPAAAAVWAEMTDHSGTPREQASRLISLLFPAPLAAEIDRQFGEVVAAARAALSPATLRAQEAAMAAWHAAEQAAPGAERRRPWSCTGARTWSSRRSTPAPWPPAGPPPPSWSRAPATGSWPRSRSARPPRSATPGARHSSCIAEQTLPSRSSGCSAQRSTK